MKATKKHIIAILLFLVTSVAILEGVYIWGYIHSTVYGLSPIEYFPMPISATTTHPSQTAQNQNWKVYTNIGHGYHVSYPEEAMVAPVAEMESKTIDQSDDVVISKPGRSGTRLTVTAYVPLAPNAPSLLLEERKSLIALPLQQFAEEIRKIQFNDTNASVQGKQTGELKEITFAGQKAYAFTLTKSFKEWSRENLGHIIPEGFVFNFIFVENKSGEKLMISYPMNDPSSEQMRNSFEFIK